MTYENPSTFINKLGSSPAINVHEQQDVVDILHSFLNFLVRDNVIDNESLQLTLEQTIECSECNNISATVQRNIIVPVELAIQKCFEPVFLHDETAYFCTCGEHVEAVQKVACTTAPKVLFLQLCRFRQIAGSTFNVRKDHSLVYPNNRMNEVTRDGPESEHQVCYRLRETIHHVGEFSQGHYFCS